MVAGQSVRIEILTGAPPTIVNVWANGKRSAVLAGDDAFATVRAAVQYALHLK